MRERAGRAGEEGRRCGVDHSRRAREQEAPARRAEHEPKRAKREEQREARASAGAAGAGARRRALETEARPKGPTPPRPSSRRHLALLPAAPACRHPLAVHQSRAEPPRPHKAPPTRHGRRPRRLHSRPRRGGRRAQECPAALFVTPAEGTSTPPGRRTARKPRHGRLLGRVLPRRRDCRACPLSLRLSHPWSCAHSRVMHELARCARGERVRLSGDGRLAAQLVLEDPRRKQHRLTLYASTARSRPHR